MTVRERFVVANGLRHHVVEWGDAHARDVVVMCHGFLDLAWGFSALADKLASENLRLIAFDWRGHGETEWIGKGGYYHFADYVLDLHALAPQLVEGPFHLVGHSMGGTACTLYAATHIDRIRTLALLEGLGPPAEQADKAPERMKTWLAGVDAVRKEKGPAKLRDLEHAVERLRARNPDLEPQLVRFLAEKATTAHPAGHGLTWRFDPLHRTLAPVGFDLGRFMRFAAQIKAPTLVLQGAHGLRTGDDDQRIAMLPHAQRAAIEGAGHMMHWTHPEATAQLLKTFWASSV